MGSRLLWRRSATAVGLYTSVALGLLGTVVAFRVLGLERFGLFATALTAASFLQALLDLTMEESLTKYGFRYVAAEDWGRLRRLFGSALRIKLLGGALATLALLALAPAGAALFGTGVGWPLVAVAALPLVQAPENVASTALLLRGRYDLRGAFLALGMALRLGGIVVGVHFGVWQALALVCAAQLVSTLAIGAAGRAAFGRYPAAAPIRLGSDRREIVGFVVQSSLASGMLSLRTTLAPLLLGVVASPTQLGLYRVAQAPQSGLTAASSPVRLVLLTEQTRDWERGHEQSVMRGVRRYSMAAATLMVVAVPLFYAAMPWLIRVVFGSDGSGATDAARIILFAAAIQLVLGWTKSLPVTIGKPRLRLVTHGLETVVLLPLTVAFGAAWGATGAALAMLVAAFVFAAAWAVALTRIRAEVELRAGRGAGSAALP